MERRTFMRGLLIGASTAAATALVKLPSAEEVAALTLNEPVLFSQAKPVDILGAVRSTIMQGMPEVFIRHEGQFVPIGFMTSFSISAPVDDNISYDGNIRIVPGLKHAEATFKGYL